MKISILLLTFISLVLAMEYQSTKKSLSQKGPQSLVLVNRGPAPQPRPAPPLQTKTGRMARRRSNIPLSPKERRKRILIVTGTVGLALVLSYVIIATAPSGKKLTFIRPIVSAPNAVGRAAEYFKAMTEKATAMGLKYTPAVEVLSVANYSKYFPQLLLDTGNGTAVGRIGVLYDTFRALQKRSYHAPSGTVVSLNDIPDLNSSSFVDNEPKPAFLQQFPLTTVSVLSIDSFDVAKLFRVAGTPDERTGKIGVLNLANQRHIGGGVLNGAAQQEEELCRRSNLYMALKSVEQYFPLEKPGEVDKFTGIYTENVTVFREVGYGFCEDVFHVDVFTLAAIHLYGAPPEGFKEATASRIRAIYQCAAEHGVHTLVLAALGCGAFRNPPLIIAELFIQILQTEFEGVFKHVIFGIILSENNIGIFKERVNTLVTNNPKFTKELKSKAMADELLNWMKVRANMNFIRTQEGHRLTFLSEMMDSYITLMPSADLPPALLVDFAAFLAKKKLAKLQPCFAALGIAVLDPI